jgi:hypothetical protein
MSFPDDYRRVQMAGGIAADVDVHVGLPAQLIVDKTDWNLRLMDGVTEGGHKILMEKDLETAIQDSTLEGEALYIAIGSDSGVGQADAKARIWRSSKLKEYFDKFVDVTLTSDNTNFTVALKDAALRTGIRIAAPQVTDLNTAVNSGWYRFNPSSTLNMPSDMSTSGTAQQFLLVLSQASNNLAQLVISKDGSGKIWNRGRSDGEWTPWILATGVTQIDLDKKLSLAGGTMTGRLKLKPSTNVIASLNIESGAAVASPVDGDIWRGTDGDLTFRKGATTRKILDSGQFATETQISDGVVSLPVDSLMLHKFAGAGSPTQSWKATSFTVSTWHQNTTDQVIVINIMAVSSSSTTSRQIYGNTIPGATGRIQIGSINRGERGGNPNTLMIPAGHYWFIDGPIDTVNVAFAELS